MSSRFGWSANNEACKVKGGTLVEAGNGGGGSGGTAGSPGKGSGAATSVAPTTLEARVLKPGEGIPKDCWRNDVVDMTWYAREESVPRLSALFAGDANEFAAWIQERTYMQSHPFELAVREADLEAVSELAAKIRRRNALESDG